jgi:hypothetical protein
MKRLLAEWTWRLALLAALLWIGVELHRFHDDMLQPADDASTTATTGNEVQDSLDDLRDDVARVEDKVDAMMAAMSRSK